MGFWGSLEAIVRALPDLVIRRSNGNLHEAMVEVRSVKESLEKRSERCEEMKRTKKRTGIRS